MTDPMPIDPRDLYDAVLDCDSFVVRDPVTGTEQPISREEIAQLLAWRRQLANADPAPTGKVK